MYTNIRTEYSFKQVLGPVQKVADLLAARGVKAACISDINNTFGHYPWRKACSNAGIKPVYGVTLNVVANPGERTKQPPNPMPFIAMSHQGLTEIYELIKTAYSDDHFYYAPRLGYSDVANLSKEVCYLSGTWPDYDLLPDNVFRQVTPSFDGSALNEDSVAALDNHYMTIDDKPLYELFTGQYAGGLNQHIITEAEFLHVRPDAEWAINNANQMLNNANVELQKAPMVTYSFPTVLSRGKEEKTTNDKAKTLRMMCESQMVAPTEEYTARLDRELELIADKGFEDYFLIVSDLVNWSKNEGIFVGPARGSSAGSLVCYLIGITEVDPIPHGLIFERFIDVTRADLPDIDIDFPDHKRQDVIQYLVDKYGADNVSKIGTVSRMKPRSAIGEFAKAMGIPAWQTETLKGAVIERKGGDDRADKCLEDTFKTKVGQKFLEDYPGMILAGDIEDHARHTGTHAAGIIVCPTPLSNYCGINARDNVAMLDKVDAEYGAGLLKIDVLGLRTLSILQEAIEAIGKDLNWLYKLPLDDAATFKLLDDGHVDGIFQFEGAALQGLARQMTIDKFDDLVALTALARPGPLASGGANTFADRRMGRSKVVYLNDHPAMIDITKDTYGTIVYQEQVMRIVREIGHFDWADTSMIRRAMSKSLGDEFFNTYWEKFRQGAESEGIAQKDARVIWDNLLTFGAWGFNKSHAVSYGIVSYWTAHIKAHYAQAFAVACLNHPKDEAQSIKVLREYVGAGNDYIAVDAERSGDKWRAEDGLIFGPLTAVKGIGPKMCADILDRRSKGLKLKPGQVKKLTNPETPFTELWPTKKLYGHYYDDPKLVGVQSHHIEFINNIHDVGSYVFIGQLVEKAVQDINDHTRVMRRGGKKIDGQPLFLNFEVVDDTDSISCTIGRFQFERFGANIATNGVDSEDWYLIKGKIRDNWRRIQVENIRKITVD